MIYKVLAVIVLLTSLMGAGIMGYLLTAHFWPGFLIGAGWGLVGINLYFKLWDKGCEK